MTLNQAGGPGIEILGIPLEFVFFALTLLGVALFHHRTLEVAASGLVVIVLYRLAFAYVVGFLVMIALVGWHPHGPHEETPAASEVLH